jgi:hypothetical protein
MLVSRKVIARGCLVATLGTLLLVILAFASGDPLGGFLLLPSVVISGVLSLVSYRRFRRQPDETVRLRAF